MSVETNGPGRLRQHPIELLERRVHLSVASPIDAAAVTGAVVTFEYVGITPTISSSPYTGLMSDPTAASVRILPAVAGGPAPSQQVTFRLDGHLAGSSYINAVGGLSYFDADPGTYTLTAHYEGDANYAPADMPPTIITIPGGADPKAPFLSVVDTQSPAAVNGGAAVVGSFGVGLNFSADSTLADDMVSAAVLAVNEADPTTLIPLQTLDGPVTDIGPGTSATFTVDTPTTGLTPGTYQLVYAVHNTTSIAATIYSPNPFTVTAAAITPPAALPAVAELGRAAAPAPAVAGVRSRGLTATVGVPAGLAGTDTVAVYASETGAIDSASVLLGTVRKRVAVTRGASTAAVTVSVQTATAPAGTYVLLARVTPAAGPPTDAAAGPVLAVQPPVPQLRAAISDVVPAATFRVEGPLALTLTLTNVGNVAAAGRATVTVVMADPSLGAPQVPVRTLVRALTVRPGRPVRLRLGGRVPAGAVAAAYSGYIGVRVRVTQGAEAADAQAGDEPVVG